MKDPGWYYIFPGGTRLHYWQLRDPVNAPMSTSMVSACGLSEPGSYLFENVNLQACKKCTTKIQEQ